MAERNRIGLFQLAVPWAILVFALVMSVAEASTDCPDEASDIVTDRPGTTNSSIVVPTGSFQAENRISLDGRGHSDRVGLPQTRLRLGVADCTELLVDLPNYFERVGATPSIETTLDAQKELGKAAGALLEYVGNYLPHSESEQISDAGVTLGTNRLQQIDLSGGFGLNHDFFFNSGYPFRLDELF